jgi:hypothetical protein
MKPKPSSIPSVPVLLKFLLAAVLIIAGGTVWFLSDGGRQKLSTAAVDASADARSSLPAYPQSDVGDSTTTIDDVEPSGPAKPSRQDIEDWLASGRSNWSEDELIDALLSMERTQREELLALLSQAFRGDPQKFAAFIEHLATKWAASAPVPALLFLGGLHGQPGIIPLERRLLNEWAAKGVSEVGGALQALNASESVLPTTQVAMWTSICQAEQSEKFADLLEWVDTLKGEKNSDMRTIAIESLVRLSKPENFGRVAELIEKNIHEFGVNVWANSLLLRQAENDPRGAIQWLAKLPEEVREHEMTQMLFYDLGRRSPEVAVEVINNRALMRMLFSSGQNQTPPPGVVGTREQWVTDRAMDQFIQGLFNSAEPNREYINTCIAHFTDPALREKFTTMAQKTIFANDPSAPQAEPEPLKTK